MPYVSRCAGDPPRAIHSSRSTHRRSPVALPARYRNRPSRIRAALCRVWEKAPEHDLTPSDVAVLQAIIASGLNLDCPYNAIFAKKTTIARLSEVSGPTVYRSLNRLEAHGLIVRSQQARMGDGSLDISEIVLTDLLLSWFVPNSKNQGQTKDKCQVLEVEIQSVAATGIPLPETSYVKDPSPPASGPGKPPENANFSGSVIDGLIDGSICRTERGEQTASVDYQFAREDFVRIEGRTLPRKLIWLVKGKTLTIPQLLSLMKKAREAGQLLESYVELRRDRLLELRTVNDCFRYLSKLIGEKVDAAHLLALRSAKRILEDIAAAREEDRRAMVSWLRSIDGKTFWDGSRPMTLTVSAGHCTLIAGINGIPDRTLRNQTATLAFRKSVESGRLRPFSVSPPSSKEARSSAINRLLTTLASSSPAFSPVRKPLDIAPFQPAKS